MIFVMIGFGLSNSSLEIYGFILHTEKYFINLIKSIRNQFEFTSFWLIWNQTDVCLDPNNSEHGEYNLISCWCIRFRKKFSGCTEWPLKSLHMLRLLNTLFSIDYGRNNVYRHINRNFLHFEQGQSIIPHYYLLWGIIKQ